MSMPISARMSHPILHRRGSGPMLWMDKERQGSGMESVMSKVVEGNRLTSSLCRIAADPAQVGTLYEILGGYCHQCRNTLNSLKLSLYLARRGGAPDTSTI